MQARLRSSTTKLGCPRAFFPSPVFPSCSEASPLPASDLLYSSCWQSAMTSYADELLNDLGSDDDEQPQQQQQQAGGVDGVAVAEGGSKATAAVAGKRKYYDDLDDLSDGESDDATDGAKAAGSRSPDAAGVTLGKDGIMPAQELSSEDVQQLDLTSVSSVSSISSLLGSSKVTSVVQKIDEYEAEAKASGSSTAQLQVEGVLEHSEEYQLIVRANNVAVEVDNEIILVHRFIRDHYQPRFPELETLIVNPWDYVQAVEALGNTDDLTKPQSGGSLESILPHGTVVVISMTASTTNGKKLTEEAWVRVRDGCKVVRDLDAVRSKILGYVESRISFIAPNLSALVGSRVATKLLGVAGGLTGLSKIPACNILVLGASKKASVGLSSLHTAERHVGFINQAPLMSEVPSDYTRQANRLIAAKVALVARMDANHSAPLGTYGSKLRQELEQKIEKLMEPPPQKLTKALPVPKEGGDKKRRGGRRARKMKEIYGTSELRKMANRIEFGKAEEETGAFDETVGLGMAGSSTGRVRANVGEQRTKAKMSKKNQNRLQQLQQSSRPNLDAMGPSSKSSFGGTETSGTQTSLSFTPVQGIELADPSRQRKIDEANQKWFQKGTFSLVPGGKPGATPIVPGGPKLNANSNGQGSMGPPSSTPKRT